MPDDALLWFTGAEPRDNRERVLLATVRQEAYGWRVPGLQPQDTAVGVFIVPLHLSVDIPELPHAVTNLQVGYWPPDGPYGHALEGEWGDKYLLDSHVYGRNGLTVFGLDASPEQFGVWAANWLRHQLQRPIERRDWLDGDGNVTATRFVLANSEFVLRQTGFSLVRRFRRSPDRVERVR